MTPAAATAPAAGSPPARTLLVHGAFATQATRRAIRDWSRTVALEVDLTLPESLRRLCAAVLTVPPLLQEAEAERLQARAEAVLDAFLEDRVRLPGLATERRFRAACMSIEAWRIVVPHVVCLEYARRALAHGPFERIVVAPGAGISLPAFEQLARALGVPLEVLPFDREEPPFFWMLKRRWQRFRHRRQAAKAGAAPARLPASTGSGERWCADARLETLVANEDKAGRWHRGPGFQDPDPAALSALTDRYRAWWQAWWQDWRNAHPQEEALSDLWILEHLGDWFSRERYPLHSLLLEQARIAISKAPPQRVLVGSMRGRRELLWGLAAQDQGIPAAVYTIDCHIDPRLVFKPDLALCDDTRQCEIAASRLAPQQVVRVRSHRRPPGREIVGPPRPHTRQRLLLADTYYSGMVASSSPLLSFWAYERLVEAARALPNCDFILKFHPVRERPEAVFHLSGLHHLHLWQRERFIRSLRPPPNLRLLAPEARLSDELPHADLLLNIQSYAGLEAFALDIPVIYLQPWDEEGLYPRMNALGAMRVATDTPHLLTLIRELLGDADRRRAQLERQHAYLDYFYSDGHPSCADAAAGSPGGA
jgi:hypothetical protein